MRWRHVMAVLKKPDVKCELRTDGKKSMATGRNGYQGRTGPVYPIAALTAVSPFLHPASSSAPAVSQENRQPENFEEFIYQIWGAGIAKHFAIPYNQKLWTVPLTKWKSGLAAGCRCRTGRNPRRARCSLTPNRWGPMHVSAIHCAAAFRQ